MFLMLWIERKRDWFKVYIDESGGKKRERIELEVGLGDQLL